MAFIFLSSRLCEHFGLNCIKILKSFLLSINEFLAWQHGCSALNDDSSGEGTKIATSAIFVVSILAGVF